MENRFMIQFWLHSFSIQPMFFPFWTTSKREDLQFSFIISVMKTLKLFLMAKHKLVIDLEIFFVLSSPSIKKKKEDKHILQMAPEWK